MASSRLPAIRIETSCPAYSVGLPAKAQLADSPAEGNNGFLDGLQSAFGGTGTSSGGLGDGLKDLIDRFTGNGQQEVARSWIETGPNQQPTAFQLEQAFGEDTISALTAQTGLSRADLLSRLQSVLPTAVDTLTPDGRLPAV